MQSQQVLGPPPSRASKQKEQHSRCYDSNHSSRHHTCMRTKMTDLLQWHGMQTPVDMEAGKEKRNALPCSSGHRCGLMLERLGPEAFLPHSMQQAMSRLDAKSLSQQ